MMFICQFLQIKKENSYNAFSLKHEGCNTLRKKSQWHVSPKKTLHTRHSDMFQPWSICVEKEILLFCSDDFHWIFLLHMRWLCAKIWLKTGTVTFFTACLCLEFHMTSFRVFKVPQGPLCASVPQYLTPWRHILASDHKVPHDQILLLNNISRKVLMSSADHILNPLCPVFQVSNFLPEHRTLKQAVK